MQALTLEGDKIRSLITRDKVVGVLRPDFFCFDPLYNFVISDADCNSIIVFSPEGNLIGRKEKRMLNWRFG